jgi:hypothetical protein
MSGGSAERPGHGRNPANGAYIDYVLPSSVTDEVRLEFRDASGAVVRTVSSKDPGEKRPSADPGLHRFVWDLRQEPAKAPAKSHHADSVAGPKVPPGTYEVRLRVGSIERSERFEVKSDPRLATAPEEFREQNALALEIRDRLTRLFAVQGRSQALHAQLDALLPKPPQGPASPLQTAARELSEALRAAEAELVDPRIERPIEVIHFGPSLDFDLVDLYSIVQDAEARPTEGMKTRFRDLDAALGAVLARFQALEPKLAEVNRLVRESGLPLVPLEDPL